MLAALKQYGLVSLYFSHLCSLQIADVAPRDITLTLKALEPCEAARGADSRGADSRGVSCRGSLSQRCGRMDKEGDWSDDF